MRKCVVNFCIKDARGSSDFTIALERLVCLLYRCLEIEVIWEIVIYWCTLEKYMSIYGCVRGTKCVNFCEMLYL